MYILLLYLYLQPLKANTADINREAAQSALDCVITKVRNTVDKSKAIAPDLRETINSCIGATKNTKVQIDFIKKYSGRMYDIQLVWPAENGFGQQRIFFNDVAGLYCHDNAVGESPLKTILNISAILANTENSVLNNTCMPRDYGFGFKKINGIPKGSFRCKRICPEGQVLVGNRLPSVSYGTYIQASVTDDRDSDLLDQRESHNMDEQLERVTCVSCPIFDGKEDIEYTRTTEKTNMCYNNDGCRQGYEYLNEAPELAYHREISIFSSNVEGESKFCYEKCDGDESRDPKQKYNCIKDAKKSCEIVKKVRNNAINWSKRYQAAVKSGLAKCGVDQLKKMIDIGDAFTEDIKHRADKFLALGCKSEDGQVLGFASPSIDLYGFKRNSINNAPADIHQAVIVSNSEGLSENCLGRMRDSHEFDYTIHGLIFENLNPTIINGRKRTSDTSELMISGAIVY